MPHADDQTIAYFRKRSQEVDDLFDIGKKQAGAALLNQTLGEAKEKDAAYFLFFQGEEEGYIHGNRSRQVQFFKEAVKIRNADFFLLRNLGVCLSAKGELDDAIKLFDRALSLNPEDYRSWQQKGVSLSTKGELDEAIKLYDKALSLNPEDYKSWRQKGVSLSKKGDEDEAIKLYDKALCLNPEDYKSWRQKGVSLSDKGELDEAIKLYDKALSLNPEDYDSWRNKGISLYNKGEFDQAQEMVKTSLEIEPGNKASIDFHAFLKAKEKKRPPEESKSKILSENGRLSSTTQGIVARVRETMAADFQQFLDKMKKAQGDRDTFIEEEGKARADGAWFHVLRKWNSYTPILPTEGPDQSVGGGYFLQSFGTGVVIDPGIGFIENFYKAGFRVADIHVVIITHAHNDHNSDLESLLTLFYRRHEKDARGKVDLYLNTGAFLKFSGMLNLRGTDYLGRVHTLMPGHGYQLNEKTRLKSLQAYHDEVITRDYAVGLWFSIKGEKEERNIIISSDTSLYPPGKGKDEVIIDEEKEIWQTYGIEEDQKIHLLVPHIGSIKQQEFLENEYDANKMFYKNHLGILGTAVLITRIKPELAVISEFGEELREIQKPLVTLIEKVIEETTGDGVKLLPGDIGFIYDVLNGFICCQVSGAMMPHDQISYDENSEGEFLYYTPGKMDAKFSHAIKEWKENRLKGKLSCHKDIK